MSESRQRRLENLRRKLRKATLRIAFTKDGAERERLLDEASSLAEKIAALAG